MQLHEKICLLRKIKGWSQEDMADKLQMSVHVSRLKQISQVFGVELQDLFGMNDKMVFKLASTWHDHSSQNNFQSLMAQRELEHELETARLIIEQQNKEIKYLKEIIELMKIQS